MARRTAKHDKIADELRAKIYAGELAPGDRVPSENELAGTYGVSDDTARKALARLANDGLTEPRQGAPTTVRVFRPIRRRAVERLSAEVWGSGRSIWDIDAPDREREVQDLAVEEVDPPPLVAASLDLPEGARVMRRSRRYVIDGEPVMRAVSYLPADLVGGTVITQGDTGGGGIYKRLEDLGHKPVSFREELHTRMPRPHEVDDLDLGPGTPVILIARYAADASGRIIEINEMTLSAAKYILEYVFES